MLVLQNINDLIIADDMDIYAYLELNAHKHQLDKSNEVLIGEEVCRFIDRDIDYVLGYTTLNNTTYIVTLVPSHVEGMHLVCFYQAELFIGYHTYFFKGGVSGLQHFYNDYPELPNVLDKLNFEPKNTVAPRTIVIPACFDHKGYKSLTLKVDWTCVVCGGQRGAPRWGLSYDGSLHLAVNVWDNPCGHIENYQLLRDHYAHLINNKTPETA